MLDMSDAAIATICGTLVTIVTIVIGFLKVYTDLKYNAKKTEAIRNDTSYIADKTNRLSDKADIVEKKIDANTEVTVKGSVEATKNAVVAANTAAEAKSATVQVAEDLKKKLNGGIDDAINKAVEPIHKQLREHGIRIEELNTYVHERNHDILNALQTLANKTEVILTQINKNGKDQVGTK